MRYRCNVAPCHPPPPLLPNPVATSTLVFPDVSPTGVSGSKRRDSGKVKKGAQGNERCGKGGEGEYRNGWELLRGVTRGTASGGMSRQAEGTAGEGCTLRGGKSGGSSKVAPKFPDRDQPLSQQARGLPA